MTAIIDAATFSPLDGADPALPGDPFSRPRYSYGQLLGAEDFTAEQRYHLLRARLRNALLHGSGVVCGLDVTAVTTDDPPSAQLRCSPGLAIDQLGREIWVPETVCLDVTGLADNAAFWSQLKPPPTPDGAKDDGVRRCYAVLRYRPCLADQAPAIAAPCSDADNALAWSRVLDSHSLCLEASAPPDPHPLSRDWLALSDPSCLRARLQALMTSEPPDASQLWAQPQDAAVLLATIDLAPGDSGVKVPNPPDTSVRALLPDVQTLAEMTTGTRLIGPDTSARFSVIDVGVSVDSGAGKTSVTATLSATPNAATVTDTTVRLFTLAAGGWTLVPPNRTLNGDQIVLAVGQAWASPTTWQLCLEGAGAQPILDAQNRPLAGFCDEPAPPAGRGRDACKIFTFTA